MRFALSRACDVLSSRAAQIGDVYAYDRGSPGDEGHVIGEVLDSLRDLNARDREVRWVGRLDAAALVGLCATEGEGRSRYGTGDEKKRENREQEGGGETFWRIAN